MVKRCIIMAILCILITSCSPNDNSSQSKINGIDQIEKFPQNQSMAEPAVVVNEEKEESDNPFFPSSQQPILDIPAFPPMPIQGAFMPLEAGLRLGRDDEEPSKECFDNDDCYDPNLCTTDLCVNGVCKHHISVVCTALDQCHVVGVCDPRTGICTNPDAPDGTTCNDDNACTQTDTCQSGICMGSNPVTCTALDQCHVIGVCDPSTGICTNPDAPNGTPCNDNNACTQTDTCQSSTCVGSNPVICTALDQCHLAGTCDSSTGLCSNPNAPDDTPCSTGNQCFTNDTCQIGVCTNGTPFVCPPPGPCQVSVTCDPVNGCIYTNQPDHTSCSDDNVCTQIDTCLSGTCVGSAPVTCPTPSDPCSVSVCDPTTGDCIGQAKCSSCSCDPNTGICGPDCNSPPQDCCPPPSTSVNKGCESQTIRLNNASIDQTLKLRA